MTTTSRNKVRSAIEVYLDSLGVTLFLDWDITDERRKSMCVEYLADLFLHIEEQIDEQFNGKKVAFVEGFEEARDVNTPIEEFNKQMEQMELVKENERQAQREIEQRTTSGRLASLRRHPSYVPPLKDAGW